MPFLQFILILTLGATGVSSLADSAVTGCEGLLANHKSYERILSLHPELIKANPPQDKEDLLILLKTEIWNYLPHGSIPWKNKRAVPQKVVERIQEQFGKSYRTDEMNADDIYLFYANLLNSIYYLALREWMDDLASSLDSPIERKIALALLSRNYPSSGLLSSTLAPDITEEILKSQDWPDHLKKLYADEAALKRAQENPGFHNPCCMTSPGCLLCPNNLFWKK